MKRFCWCLSLRVGCIIISVWTILLGFVYLVEFFRLKEYHNPAHATVWPNLLLGILHILAALCLSYTVLTRGVMPIFVYVFIEIFFIIYAIIYAAVSSALQENLYANLGLHYGVSFWIFVLLVSALTIYFLLTAISFYVLKKQQRKDREYN